LPVRNLFLAALLAAAGTALNPAVAQTQTWALTQPFWPAGNAQLRLDGEASGALFGPRQPGWSRARASGAAL